MIERITPDNPLTERHAGMMAVLRNGNVCGPIIWDFEKGTRYPLLVSGFSSPWRTSGKSSLNEWLLDIIAVMPMPELSGLEGE